MILAKIESAVLCECLNFFKNGSTNSPTKNFAWALVLHLLEGMFGTPFIILILLQKKLSKRKIGHAEIDLIFLLYLTFSDLLKGLEVEATLRWWYILLKRLTSSNLIQNRQTRVQSFHQPLAQKCSCLEKSWLNSWLEERDCCLTRTWLEGSLEGLALMIFVLRPNGRASMLLFAFWTLRFLMRFLFCWKPIFCSFNLIDLPLLFQLVNSVQSLHLSNKKFPLKWSPPTTHHSCLIMQTCQSTDYARGFEIDLQKWSNIVIWLVADDWFTV